MKKKLIVSGILVCFLVLSLALVGCSDDDGGLDAKWQGTYNTYDNSGYMILSSTTSTAKTGNTTSTGSNILTAPGGTITLSTGEVTGEWVYALADGSTHGILVNITSGTAIGTYIGLGNYLGNNGVTILLNGVDGQSGIKSYGYFFSPEPLASGLPTYYYFVGHK
jgi:hypothetical protein